MILAFSIDFGQNKAQIEPFKICGRRQWKYMTFITLVVRDTIDLNSLGEFEQLKCVISVNIDDFVFFPLISAQIKPKLSHLSIKSTF